MTRIEDIKQRLDEFTEWSKVERYSASEKSSFDDIKYLLTLVEKYKEAHKYIYDKLWKLRSITNNMENTEHEQGQLRGWLDGIQILEEAIKRAEMSDEERKKEEEERFQKTFEFLRKLNDLRVAPSSDSIRLAEGGGRVSGLEPIGRKKMQEEQPEPTETVDTLKEHYTDHTTKLLNKIYGEEERK